MENLIQSTVLAKALITFGLSMVYLYLFIQYRERYMGYWSLSWVLYAVRLFMDFLRYSGFDSLFFLAVNQASTILCAIFLLYGIYSFIEKKVPVWWIYAGVAATLMTDIFFLLNTSLVIAALPTATFFGIAQIWTGVLFLMHWEIRGLGKYVTGVTLVLAGLANLGYPFDSAELSELTLWAFIIPAIMDFIIILGTLLIHFQKVRKDLSESEKRFRLLAENAKDIIYRYNITPRQGFEYISPAVYNITGYTPDAFYTNPDLMFQITHPEDVGLLYSLSKTPVPKNEPVLLRLHGRDNKLIWTEQQYTPVQDNSATKEDGMGIGLSVCYNIAAKHNAEIKVETGPSGTAFFVRFRLVNSFEVTGCNVI